MANIGDIDFASVPESDGYQPIPAGDYTAVITASEVSDNKKGTGKYVKFTFQICEGQYQNRLIWRYVNFLNSNAEAQNIGRRELKELGLACGYEQYSDTAVLHNKPIRIRVGMEKGQDGEERNVIKRVLWKETFAPPTSGAASSDEVPF